MVFVMTTVSCGATSGDFLRLYPSSQTNTCGLRCGVWMLTPCRGRHITSPSWRPASCWVMGVGQNSLKSLPVWAYQGTTTGASMVRPLGGATSPLAEGEEY